MAQGMRSSEDRRVQDALDLCLARLREGASLEACLADAGDLADALRPMLLVAGELQALGQIPPPAAPRGLAEGRARFLAAAGGALGAAAPALAPLEELGPAEDAELAEYLDRGLARLQAGLPIESAAAVDGAATAEAVRPLLALAAEIGRRRVDPPPAPERLAPGRARYLAAAAAARVEAESSALNGLTGAAALAASAAAQHEAAGLDPAATEALDQALARLRAGERLDAILAGLAPAAATALAPLLEMGAALSADAIRPPAPPAGLAPGRARFLNLAAQAQAHHASVDRARATATASAAAGRGGRAWRWRGGGGLLRLAAASMAAVFLFLGGIVALENSAPVANALPGDVVYLFKRVNEEIDLALTRDPAERAALQALHDRRRADEAERLLSLGREAELSLRAVLVSAEARGGPGDAPGGLLLVRVPPEGTDARERAIGWDGRTVFELGGFPDATALPAGTQLRLRVLTSGQGGAWVVALGLEVLGLPPTAEVAAADQPGTATPTLESQDPTEPPPTGTLPPGTATLPPPTQTLPPTQPPATPTVIATIVPTQPAPQQGQTPKDRLVGTVVDQPSGGIWIVATDGCPPERLVRVDASALGETAGRDVRNMVVQLVGEYVDANRTEFRAERLRGAPSPDDQIVESFGVVKALPGDGRIVLTDDSEYLLGSAPVRGGVLEVGSTVRIGYRRCAAGTPEAIAIEVTAGPAGPTQPKTARGLVTGLEAGSRFTLSTDGSDPDLPAQVPVRIDASTEIFGVAESLAEGQVVEVRGEWDPATGLLHARMIVIEEAAPAPSPGAGQGAGEATAIPIPSATPEATPSALAPGEDPPAP